jgi:hypothetical protein
MGRREEKQARKALQQVSQLLCGPRLRACLKKTLPCAKIVTSIKRAIADLFFV